MTDHTCRNTQSPSSPTASASSQQYATSSASGLDRHAQQAYYAPRLDPSQRIEGECAINRRHVRWVVCVGQLIKMDVYYQQILPPRIPVRLLRIRRLTILPRPRRTRVARYRIPSTQVGTIFPPPTLLLRNCRCVCADAEADREDRFVAQTAHLTCRHAVPVSAGVAAAPIAQPSG